VHKGNELKAAFLSQLKKDGKKRNGKGISQRNRPDICWEGYPSKIFHLERKFYIYIMPYLIGETREKAYNTGFARQERKLRKGQAYTADRGITI